MYLFAVEPYYAVFLGACGADVVQAGPLVCPFVPSHGSGAVIGFIFGPRIRCWAGLP